MNNRGRSGHAKMMKTRRQNRLARGEVKIPSHTKAEQDALIEKVVKKAMRNAKRVRQNADDVVWYIRPCFGGGRIRATRIG